jgi:hypothetical protein
MPDACSWDRGTVRRTVTVPVNPINCLLETRVETGCRRGVRMMASRRIQPYVAAIQPQASSMVQVRRYDAEGRLQVAADPERRALPPIVVSRPRPSRTTRDHEKDAIQHSKNRAQRRRYAESASLAREGDQQPQPQPVAGGRLSSGFRTDGQAAKRRAEMQDARDAMMWRAIGGGAGSGSWQPSVSANYRNVPDLHSADLVSPDPKNPLNQTSPKRKKAGSKNRAAAGSKSRATGGGSPNKTAPWENFTLPALGPQARGGADPTSMQPWLAGDGWQGSGMDADFSPWGELSPD